MLTLSAAFAQTPQATRKAPKATVHKAGTTSRQAHTANHAKPASHTTLHSRSTPVAATPASHFAPIAPHPALRSVALDPVPEPFLYPNALDPFFHALSVHQAEAASGSPNPEASTVRVLQFGDSHTAADLFTGAMRSDLQTRFGDGGLGFQYPGHPFPGYHLAGSSRSQSAGWLTEGNKFTLLTDGEALGLGGISISTTRPGEWITLATTCTTLQIQYLRQPGGGRLSFTDNGAYISEIDTSTDIHPNVPSAPGAGTLTYACTPGVHDFELTTLERAPVRLFGLVTEQPGITWECLGINGAVAPLMLRWDQNLFAEYLRQRDPTLLVLAYGTNEASASAAKNEEYTAEFDRLLDNLHRIVPSAAILVLGPYDRATRIGRKGHAIWQTYRGIDRIVADQRAACRTHNCAFYDQRARMGGPGTMLHWAASGLAQPDRTHLTGTGYRTLADALSADLLAAYDKAAFSP
jgi:lysophospholipase L1-like esterase